MKNQRGSRGKTTKYKVAGATVSTAFIAAQSVIPAVVLAANQYDWVKQEGIDTESGSITTTASSANGSHLILGGEGNVGLYISDDAGSTWENVAAEIDPGVQNFWSSVDVSNDGQIMVVASDGGYDEEAAEGVGGRIFISENGGANWSNITPPGDDDNWEDVVVSGDGSTIIAGGWESANVYISENDGEDWTANEYVEDAWNVKNIAVSDNGNKILIGGENGQDPFTHVYLSENSGNEWAEIDPNPDDQPYLVKSAISADGNTLAVATSGYSDSQNDAVFISENDGEDWTNSTPAHDGVTVWGDLALSDDGSTLGAVDIENSKMYISNNTGADWAEENPAQDYEEFPDLVAADMNSDGSKFIVASDQNVYLNEATDNESTVTLDDAVGGKTISITTPEGTTITCHSAAKESEMAVTDTAYTYPLGLVDFCFSGADANNEVTLVFVTNLKPDEVLVRKYDPATDKYSTVTEATVTETMHEGKHALQVTYNIVDNGPLDTDPDSGEVADPVGLAVIGSDDGALADTGNSVNSAVVIATGLLGVGFFFLLRQRRTE